MVKKSHKIVVSDILAAKVIEVAPSDDWAATDEDVNDWVFVIGRTFADDNDVIVVVDDECIISAETFNIGLNIEFKSIVSWRIFHDVTNTLFTLSKVSPS